MREIIVGGHERELEICVCVESLKMNILGRDTMDMIVLRIPRMWKKGNKIVQEDSCQSITDSSLSNHIVSKLYYNIVKES